MTRPTWDQYFGMQTTVIAMRSDDEETKIGAIIVDDRNRVIATGYNGTPAGTTFPKTRPEKYPFMIHAEANAIISAKADLEGCILYVSKYFPCTSCAGMIVNSGIKEVVTVNRDEPETASGVWNTVDSGKIFEQAGVRVRSIFVDLSRFL